MTELPIGWDYLRLSTIAGKTSNIDPSRFPEEIFELYSVPSFFSGAPEIVPGSTIRSAKQSVQKGDVLLCKIVPHLNRVWTVAAMGTLRQIASGEWIVYRNHGCVPAFLRYCLSESSFRNRLMSTVSGVGGSLSTGSAESRSGV